MLFQQNFEGQLKRFQNSTSFKESNVWNLQEKKQASSIIVLAFKMVTSSPNKPVSAFRLFQSVQLWAKAAMMTSCLRALRFQWRNGSTKEESQRHQQWKLWGTVCWHCTTHGSMWAKEVVWPQWCHHKFLRSSSLGRGEAWTSWRF